MAVSRYRLVTTVSPPVLERVHERVHKGDADDWWIPRAKPGALAGVNPPIIVFRATVRACVQGIVQRGKGGCSC